MVGYDFKITWVSILGIRRRRCSAICSQASLIRIHPLVNYDWPGNVRELVNVCGRLTALSPGRVVRLKDLPTALGEQSVTQSVPRNWSDLLRLWATHQLQDDAAPPLLTQAYPELEKTLIRVAMEHCAGRRQDAAKILGWGRNTLTRKIRELGLE